MQIETLILVTRTEKQKGKCEVHLRTPSAYVPQEMWKTKREEGRPLGELLMRELIGR